MASSLVFFSAANAQLELKLDYLRFGPITIERALVGLSTEDGYYLKVGHLNLPFTPKIEQIDLSCPHGYRQRSFLECPYGQLQLRLPRFGQSLSAAGKAIIGPNRWQLSLSPLRFAGGHLKLWAEYQKERWYARLEAIKPIKLNWIKAMFSGVLAKLQGNASFRLEAQGGSTLDKLNFNLTGKNLSFHDLGYRRVADGLHVKLQLQGQGQTFFLRSEIPAGESLYFPVYLPFRDYPVTLKAFFSLAPPTAEVLLHELKLSQLNVLTATARGRLSQNSLNFVTDFQADLPTLFRLYGQPFLAGSRWEGIEFLAGKVRGRATISDDSKARASVHVERAVLSDRERRFGLNRLGADLVWQSSQATYSFPSRIHWQAGHLYAIPLGKTELHFYLSGDDVYLDAPSDLPVLDGHLRIEQLEILDLITAPRIQFSGRLEPISLDLLSRVLGWPPMVGTVSGSIPQVRYDHRWRTLELDGRLTIQAFAGTIAIEHLKIVDLFGALPRLYADVYVHNVDLEQITKRFAFGRITGKLEGSIDGLELENWRPVAFSAWFGTPADDRSRHRINQKAVENLTHLGGGFAADFLSRTLLRVFNEFSYARLGVGCRLKSGVCELAGIAPVNGGYYIVQGGGLPRVDVIGYNRRISWLTLINRLARIAKLKPPPVQP
ncbi:MAG: hypothetical protein N3A55_08910 [Methylohalobius sp.]|nr:hypothetical protein [Methylohalobius sp.]